MEYYSFLSNLNAFDAIIIDELFIDMKEPNNKLLLFGSFNIVRFF
ncbi:hypothetical protein C8C87_1358 [Flavobacterium sp. 120]|nr:hypothetical protein C8C87_1358 [Flavobacterium sp. 120]